MSYKQTIIKMLEKIGDDEPLFLVRAQDVLAPGLVNRWARKAGEIGVNPDKVKEACRCRDAMRLWPNKKLPD